MSRKIKHIFLFIGAVLIIILIPSISLEAKSRPKMTCKYFDSLMKNHERCIPVHPGKEVDVEPGGPNKELYRDAYLFLSKTTGYKELMKGRKGVVHYYKAYAVDLNGDRVEEFVLLPMSWVGEDTSMHEMLRGATGIGDIFIFQKKMVGKSLKWKCIARIDGLLLRLEHRKTNRYHDLIVHTHGSFNESTLERYIYKSSTGIYRPIKTKNLRCAPYSEYFCYHPR